MMIQRQEASSWGAAICSADMHPNVRGFSIGFHPAPGAVLDKDCTRTRVAAPSLKAADIGQHVRATCLLAP